MIGRAITALSVLLGLGLYGAVVHAETLNRTMWSRAYGVLLGLVLGAAALARLVERRYQPGPPAESPRPTLAHRSGPRRCRRRARVRSVQGPKRRALR